MPRKKHFPGEELFNDEKPDVPIVEETSEEVPVEAVAPPIEASAPVEAVKSDVCANCGLPKKDFREIYLKLRLDLQIQNKRTLCPRCFKPVEPY